MTREKWIFILISLVLVAGVVFGYVWTDTDDAKCEDYGIYANGRVFCQAAASHAFYFNCNSAIYSCATSLFHNGSYVDDDYMSGEWDEAGYYILFTLASGHPEPVYQPHYTTASHGSYIENAENVNDSYQDTAQSWDYRDSD